MTSSHGFRKKLLTVTFLGIGSSLPATVKVKGGNLKVAVSDLKMVEVDIPAQEVGQGSTTLILNTFLDNALIDDFRYRHLSRGEKPHVSIEGGVRVGTPLNNAQAPPQRPL